ncbi:MAG: serine/threonine-protein kinase, partial [Planctomycetota bacterium]|nr:serine/threonine-protein kinase [Planctomycetota bacterium]
MNLRDLQQTLENVAGCPDAATLSRLVRADVDEQAAEELIGHLDTCSNCRDHVETQWHRHDSVVRNLRKHRELPSLGHDVEQLVAHLASMSKELRMASANGDFDPQTMIESDFGAGTQNPLNSKRSGDDESMVEQLGQYRLLEKLGQGGMGSVYRAMHTKLKRVAAIKTLSPAYVDRPEAVARFHREMEAVGRLKHPNIIEAHDASEADGIHFLVMEYVDGMDLGQLVRSGGPLSVSRSVGYILAAARGLCYAHQEGVVHRDIKPSNLMLDKTGCIKVLDMGLARLEDPNAVNAQGVGFTMTGQVMGTVDYMSPEQALDTRTADERADIYSLGCTLHFLLTASPAYGGETLTQKLISHREHPIPNLCDMIGQFPAELNDVFQKMVAKSVDDRYQSMADVVSDLEACQPGLPSSPGDSASFPAIASMDSRAALRPASDGSSQHQRTDPILSSNADSVLDPNRTVPPAAPAAAIADSSLSNATIPPSASGPAPLGVFVGRLPEQFGRYRIIRMLGEGGMGAVYLAEDRQLERKVAIKVPLISRNDESIMSRFVREARAVAALQHANICPVFEVDEVHGIHYMAMAYIEGKPLSDFISAEPTKSVRESLEIVRTLALALDLAHQKGVIHRDLKPDNIMINEQGEPVIMDFGLARRRGSSDPALTQEGTIMGTPAYMPPEQVAGNVEAMGPSCDIYSLGVILYELLSGSVPFTGDTLMILSQIALKAPTPLTELGKDIDSRVDALCAKAMQKQVADRYSTMKEFAAAITELLTTLDSTEPKTGESKSRKQKAEKSKSQSRANTKPLAIGGGVLGLGVCIALTIWWFNRDSGDVETDPSIVIAESGKSPEAESKSKQPKSTSKQPTWLPGPDEDVLPGLVARPRTFDGIKRWQVETTAPRA